MVNERLIKLLKSELYANKSILKTISGEQFCKNRATLQLKIGEIEDTLNFFVVKNNSFDYDLLLGLDAIKKFRLIQDENLQIKQKLRDNVDGVNDNELKKETDLDHLECEKRLEIKTLLNKYNKCFASNKFDVGSIGNYEAEIRLKEDRYIAKKPYRCSFPDQKEIDAQISKLLENDLIEESSSPFAAPVTLAFKKEDGKRTRLCIDFRELNKIVIPEPQPFPRIDDLIVDVGDCKCFTALDVNSAFWSIPIRQKDRRKTAFITQKGHWQWKVLPFGYKNAPAIFQRRLASIVRKHGLISFCTNYIDDLLIFSKSYNEHLQHLRLVFEAMKKEGIKLKLEKCKFATRSVKYLGHMIEDGKIYPIQDNLVAIREFRRPTSRKMVRQLLGKINFYRKFIDQCTDRLSPLHNLLKKK